MNADLAKLIKAYGFDKINDHVTRGVASFTPQSIREYDQSKYVLSKINNPQTSYPEAIKAMESNNIYPANIYELLNWKGWDKQSMVVALDSQTSIDGVNYVPCITLEHFKEPDRYYTERRLSLIATNINWMGAMYFLGFKK